MRTPGVRVSATPQRMQTTPSLAPENQVEAEIWVSVVRGTTVRLPRKFRFPEKEGPSSLVGEQSCWSPLSIPGAKQVWLASAATASGGQGHTTCSETPLLPVPGKVRDKHPLVNPLSLHHLRLS